MALKLFFFPKKIPKNCPGAGGLAPRTPSGIHLSYTRLLDASLSLNVFAFNFVFKPSPFSKILVTVFDHIACNTHGHVTRISF